MMMTSKLEIFANFRQVLSKCNVIPPIMWSYNVIPKWRNLDLYFKLDETINCWNLRLFVFAKYWKVAEKFCKIRPVVLIVVTSFNTFQWIRAFWTRDGCFALKTILNKIPVWNGIRHISLLTHLNKFYSKLMRHVLLKIRRKTPRTFINDSKQFMTVLTRPYFSFSSSWSLSVFSFDWIYINENLFGIR